MTSTSDDDDELKLWLGRLLWGYPHIVEIVFSEYVDVRSRIIEQRQTKKIDREATPAESKKEFRPPPLSEPSTGLWAHAKGEDIVRDITFISLYFLSILYSRQLLLVYN